MIPENAIEIPFHFTPFIYNIHQEKNIKSFYDEENHKFYLQIVPGNQLQGPPNHVHGGYIASILDEAMGAIVFLSGFFGLTQHMEIHYRRPIPLFRTHYVESGILKKEKRKIFTEARIFSENTLYTVASAVFLEFDIRKLGTTPEYELFFRFQEFRKTTSSFKEAMDKFRQELPDF